LGGGLPIGATMLGERVKDLFTPGLNGSTFGGNPVCAAGALSVLSRIDESLLSAVQEKSKYIFDQLSGSKGIISVSGLGLMIGVETERPAAEVIEKCRERGVLVIKA
jgi:acetylornithine/N-succinyldiaminopimelate aminotransferase